MTKELAPLLDGNDEIWITAEAVRRVLVMCYGERWARASQSAVNRTWRTNDRPFYAVMELLEANAPKVEALLERGEPRSDGYLGDVGHTRIRGSLADVQLRVAWTPQGRILVCVKEDPVDELIERVEAA